MTPRTAIALPIALAGTLAACAGTSPALAAGQQSSGGMRVPTSSVVRTFEHSPSSALATWYGPGFYGHTTACGQMLTTRTVGVANRRLPCGTVMRVSYADHTLLVPVIDRGPYGGIGAEWDLTAGAAEALGITETVRIGVHLAGSEPNTPTLGLPAGALLETTLGGGAIAG